MVSLTYSTYAIYGERLAGRTFALPAFGSEPADAEPLPAKRTRRAPAKLDADDAAAAAVDDESFTAAPVVSAARSKSPARTRATPARRAASPARR